MLIEGIGTPTRANGLSEVGRLGPARSPIGAYGASHKQM